MNTNAENLLKLDEQRRFRAIETGAKFPVDAPTYEGECECCDRGQTEVALIQMTDSGMGMTDTATACAECYADFVAGQAVMPQLEIRFLPGIKVEFCMAASASVSALPDADAIYSVVAEKFATRVAKEIVTGVRVDEKGSYDSLSLPIKVEHPSGKIWGYPEKHPHKWMVTVCYQRER